MEGSQSDPAGSAASIKSQMQQAAKKADGDIVLLNARQQKALDKQQEKEKKAAEKADKTMAKKQEAEEEKAEPKKTKKGIPKTAKQQPSLSMLMSSNPRSNEQLLQDDLIKPASPHSHTSWFDVDARECKYLNTPIATILKKVKKQMMDADQKKALAVELKKAKTERQMSAFLDKDGNQQVKALFDKWKVKVEDDESYHPSEADNQEKSKLNYFSGKKARGRPKTNASNNKLAKILKSIVKENAPTATLLAEQAYTHVEFATKYMGCALGNAAFYEYVDSHCYPFFPSLLENPGTNLQKFKGLASDDFIYLVFKHYLEHPDMPPEQLARLRDFAHAKFLNIPADFDMSLVPVKDPSRLAVFYKSYAQRIDDKSWGSGWQQSCVLSAVMHGHIQVFVEQARHRVANSSTAKDVEKSIAGSKLVSPKGKPERHGDFSKILSALNKVYPSITVEVGRLILQAPSLASGQTLSILGDLGDFVLLAAKLLGFVLQPNDYATSSKEIKQLIYNDDLICEVLTHTYMSSVPSLQRLNLQQLQDLVQNYKSFGNADLADRLKDRDKFLELIKPVKVIAKRRTGLDDKEMQMIEEKVNGLLTDDAELKQWYETSKSFLAFFQQKESMQGFYQPKPYQMYIAAKICQRIALGDKERFVMMLGAGQGKTLVFLLVCMMLMKDDRTKTDFKKCCLITITRTLYTQLQDIVRRHQIKNIDVHKADQFGLIVSQNFDLHVIDEADLVTKTCAVQINTKFELEGLYYLRQKKFLMCSATFSLFEAEIVKQALEIDEEEWMRFDPAPAFVGNGDGQPNIIYDSSIDDADTKRKITEFIIANQSVPVLIFLEMTNDKVCCDAIQDVCTSHKLQLNECLTEDDLKLFTQEAVMRSSGVFTFDKGFGRGIDFKLQQDAKVLVLMNGEQKLTTADIGQMAGRGTRAQTIPCATLIVTKIRQGVTPQALVTRNDEDDEVYEAPKLVSLLYKRWPSATGSGKSKGRKALANLLKDDAWRKGFAGLTTNQVNWLYGSTETLKISEEDKEDKN